MLVHCQSKSNNIILISGPTEGADGINVAKGVLQLSCLHNKSCLVASVLGASPEQRNWLTFVHFLHFHVPHRNSTFFGKAYQFHVPGYKVYKIHSVTTEANGCLSEGVCLCSLLKEVHTSVASSVLAIITK